MGPSIYSPAETQELSSIMSEYPPIQNTPHNSNIDPHLAMAMEEKLTNHLQSEIMEQIFGKTATVLRSSQGGSDTGNFSKMQPLHHRETQAEWTIKSINSGAISMLSNNRTHQKLPEIKEKVAVRKILPI